MVGEEEGSQVVVLHLYNSIVGVVASCISFTCASGTKMKITQKHIVIQKLVPHQNVV